MGGRGCIPRWINKIFLLRSDTQDFAHRRDTEDTEFIIFFIQSGDDDWIKEIIPSGVFLRWNVVYVHAINCKVEEPCPPWAD